MLISTAGAICPGSPALQLRSRVTEGEFNQGAGPRDAASASETQSPAAGSPAQQIALLQPPTEV